MSEEVYNITRPTIHGAKTFYREEGETIQELHIRAHQETLAAHMMDQKKPANFGLPTQKECWDYANDFLKYNFSGYRCTPMPPSTVIAFGKGLFKYHEDFGYGIFILGEKNLFRVVQIHALAAITKSLGSTLDRYNCTDVLGFHEAGGTATITKGKAAVITLGDMSLEKLTDKQKPLFARNFNKLIAFRKSVGPILISDTLGGDHVSNKEYLSALVEHLPITSI
jgi:hypothetical protein